MTQGNSGGKWLHIHCRNKWYNVNKRGEITYCGYDTPSGQWIFLGVSTHHWHRRIIHDCAACFANPKLAVGGYVWDRDHGTVRTWAGERVTQAYVSDSQHD